MIFLYTDFGHEGPYLGQLRAVLAREAPQETVIDLMHDVPPCDPRAGAYLLAALADAIPAGSIVLGVVDPGVGTEAREPVALHAGGRWYVGPGNGLFTIAARRTAEVDVWRITWAPERLSASFHGRDLFAPVAAMLARGEAPPGEPAGPSLLGPEDWPDDLAEIVYIDHWGNAITGLRAANVERTRALDVRGARCRFARTFAQAPPQEAFWYENSCGLAEIAVDRGSARELLRLRVGDPVRVTAGGQI
ncbi:MAG: SAM-dependent chlorinase/fluorinase [Gammaproteobacteria bacterium]|nr:SAM-dependent chlorinase/fluorinase [Gammaproteobacteria bacterium]